MQEDASHVVGMGMVVNVLVIVVMVMRGMLMGRMAVAGVRMTMSVVVFGTIVARVVIVFLVVMVSICQKGIMPLCLLVNDFVMIVRVFVTMVASAMIVVCMGMTARMLVRVFFSVGFRQRM